MLPEQHDILFSFIAILFAVFGVFVFGNVIQACREREGLNTNLWGGIFGVYAIVCFLMTVHMFDLVQADQLKFFFSTYLWVVITLLLMSFKKIIYLMFLVGTLIFPLKAFCEVSYIETTAKGKAETLEIALKKALKEGKIVNTGVRAKKAKDDINFYKIGGDMYLVTDYSEDFKFVYNERSFGMFLKETRDLVQIGRNDLIRIHKFIL